MNKPTISIPSDTTDWERVAAMSDDEIDASADPFDADNPESIDTFWKDAVVTRDGAEATADAVSASKGRGPQKTPKKVLLDHPR